MAKLTEDFIVKSDFPYMNPPKGNLWSFIEQSCRKYSSNAALEDKYEGIVLTYEEVFQRAEAIAANLIKLNFDVNKSLAICMNTSIDFMLVTFATWRLGGTIAMITPLLTSGEIQAQFETVDPDIVVCDETTVSNVIQASKGCCTIKSIICKHPHQECLHLSDLIKKPGDVDLSPPCTDGEDKTGLIPFSSGTTGPPKGIDLTHGIFQKQIYYFSYATQMHMHTSTGIVYQPLAHVWGMLILLAYFGFGNKIVVMETLDLAKYMAYVAEEKIQKIFVTPPVVVQFCKSDLAKEFDFTHVKEVISASAPLSQKQEFELKEVLGGKPKIYQVHGMTEAGVTIVPFNPTYSYPSGTVGWPIGRTILKVIDLTTGQNLGPNKQGEICLKNDFYMKGYYRNSEATSKAIDKDGWLLTGDLGYYDEQNCFFFVDRLKEMIRYRFYQVAPSELEAILLTHPAVADVAVTSLPSPEDGEHPIAWIALKPDKTATEDELHSFLNTQIAPFKKLRGGITFVDKIPKSKTGKILRRLIRDKVREPQQ